MPLEQKVPVEKRPRTLEEADGRRGHSQDTSADEREHARARCDAGSLGLMDGPDVRLGPGSWRSRHGVVEDDGRQPCFKPDRRRSRSAPGGVCHRIRHCAPSTRCGTPIHCERSCPSIGPKSPGRCASSGCARWENPAQPWPWWTSTRTCGAPRCRCGRRPDSAGWAWQAFRRRRAVCSLATDKRFAAPEWHTNPVYRTLKQIYLLASDWLLQQSDVETAWMRPSGSASTSTCASSWTQ